MNSAFLASIDRGLSKRQGRLVVISLIPIFDLIYIYLLSHVAFQRVFAFIDWILDVSSKGQRI